MDRNRAQDILERDIGKMVIRIDSLIAQLEEALEANAALKKQIADAVVGDKPNGS